NHCEIEPTSFFFFSCGEGMKSIREKASASKKRQTYVVSLWGRRELGHLVSGNNAAIYSSALSLSRSLFLSLSLSLSPTHRPLQQHNKGKGNSTRAESHIAIDTERERERE